MASRSMRSMMLWSNEPDDAPRLNPAFTAEFGLTSEDLARQRLLDWVHPDDTEALERTLTAGSGGVRARLRTARDEWISLDWSVRTHEGRVAVCGRATRASEVVSRSPEPRVRHGDVTLAETLAAMVRVVEWRAPGLRCSILLIDSAGESVTVGAAPSLPDEYNAAVQGLRIGPTVGSCGTAAFWNMPVVVEDINEDPLWKDLRSAAAIAGVAACWSVPITATTGGDVLGAMALYDDKPSAPTQQQMDVLELAARMVGLAIERDGLEGQLRHAMKMDAVGQLAGGIAHDFNNLLTIIQGNTQILERRALGAGRTQIERIRGATRRAARLTSQLLAFSRKQVIQPRALDLGDAVVAITDLLRKVIGEDIRIRIERDPSLGCVMADPGQVDQVVVNLAMNARDAMPTGGDLTFATRNVELSAAAAAAHPDAHPGRYVALAVSDTGEGMTPAITARIFDPYFTTKAEGKGNGLGLATTYGIVRQNEGFVHVQSARGRGSCFTVYLPRVARDTPDASRVGIPVADVTERGTETILVAEDEEPLRDLVTDLLTEQGYHVLDGANPDAVVAAADAHEGGIDMLVTDVVMPEQNGPELLQRVRALYPNCRVLFMSGYAGDAISQLGVLDRGVAFLQKPFSVEELLSSVRETLDAQPAG